MSYQFSRFATGFQKNAIPQTTYLAPVLLIITLLKIDYSPLSIGDTNSRHPPTELKGKGGANGTQDQVDNAVENTNCR
jgi:hypothetical protein